MRNIVLSILIAVVAFSILPLPAQAQGFVLVPCGRSDQQNTPYAQCTVRHFAIAAIRLINYLISAGALVAMYQVLLAGWNLIGSMGNAEKAEAAKKGISEAVVGFVIVVAAFVFINLLVNGIFGSGDTEHPTRWWSVDCIYDITNSTTNECVGG